MSDETDHQSSGLVRYDAACRALAEAKSVDEVKDLRDKAVAMAAYARQARNRDLEADAIEIRMRATRRLDQLRQVQKETIGLNRGAAAPTRVDEKPTLASQGIDKNLAHQARTLGALSDEQFEGKVAEARDAIGKVVKSVVDIGDKAAKRAAREAELAASQRSLPEKRYGVILADPEWRFEPRSRETGMDRSADNHYPTSSTDEICARDVPSISADDCALFLCATAPMLEHALRVMKSWGFEYKTHRVWNKVRPGEQTGTGYWFTGEHELILLGTRGNVPCPAPGTQLRSNFFAPVGKHSEKPECIAEMIERYFPNLPKIELNRRGPPRPGWDAWGNEVTNIDETAA